MTRCLLILLAISFSAKLYGQDLRKELPAVSRILDKAAAEVRRNRVDFDQANQKPLADARKALEEFSSKLIEDGKTEEAAAVLQRLKTLEADVMSMAKAPASISDSGKSAIQRPLLQLVQGKWRRGKNKTIDIRQDTVHQSHGDNGRLTLLSPTVVGAVFESGWKWQIRVLDDDMIAVMEWGPNGHRTDGIVFERIK